MQPQGERHFLFRLLAFHLSRTREFVLFRGGLCTVSLLGGMLFPRISSIYCMPLFHLPTLPPIDTHHQHAEPRPGSGDGALKRQGYQGWGIGGGVGRGHGKNRF